MVDTGVVVVVGDIVVEELKVSALNDRKKHGCVRLGME